MRGIFLVLEGVDGSGKSTQLEMLGDWLTHRGHAVVRCREPGGTAIGERVRQLLLDVRSEMTPLCEMLLYMASRAQLVDDVIRPALAENRVVLCDRFLVSTLVYQGYAGGLEVESICRVGEMATGGLTPDWTGVLELDPEAARSRRRGPADRIEARAPAFHQKVREGYLAEFVRDPKHISIIDADGDPNEVHRRVIAEVSRVLDQADRS